MVLHLAVLAAVVAAPIVSSSLSAASETCSAPGECTSNAAVKRGSEALSLPRVIVGCWQLLERDSNPAAAVRTLTAYAQAGFNAFDTADIYGPSEQILGEFRQQWVAANPGAAPLRFFTKYVTDDPSGENAARTNSRSLKSMGIDVADMVQFHWWSLSKDGSQKTFLKAGRELTRLKDQGKIRHLAGCNMDTTSLKMLVDDGMAIEANQVQYSLLDRRPEVRLLSYCKEQGVQITAFGVVAGGLLSDAFLGLSQAKAQSMLDSVSRRMYWSSLQRWTTRWDLFQKLLEVLSSIGKRKEPPLPIAAVASAWVLERMDALGAGGALILGVRDSRHLAEHVALLRGEVRLDAGDMSEILAVLEQGAAPKGDVWYQERGWA